MHHERFYNQLYQALSQAGLEPLAFQERLDTTELSREVVVGALLPGARWPARANVEFSYLWTAGDTARSHGELEPDPLASVIELSCTLHYSPLAEEYSVRVADLAALQAFTRELLGRLPLALKDERGGNSADVHLLVGEDGELLLFGPIAFQLHQLVELDGDGGDDDGEAAGDRELQANLRDLAADALRGLMALDTLEPPADLFERLPETGDDDEDDEGDADDEDGRETGAGEAG
jgi:hypothetical protein